MVASVVGSAEEAKAPTTVAVTRAAVREAATVLVTADMVVMVVVGWEAARVVVVDARAWLKVAGVKEAEPLAAPMVEAWVAQKVAAVAVRAGRAMVDSRVAAGTAVAKVAVWAAARVAAKVVEVVARLEVVHPAVALSAAQMEAMWERAAVQMVVMMAAPKALAT